MSTPDFVTILAAKRTAIGAFQGALSKTSAVELGAAAIDGCMQYTAVSKESIDHHIEAARNAILYYIHQTGNSKFVDGKMIFLTLKILLH